MINKKHIKKIIILIIITVLSITSYIFITKKLKKAKSLSTYQFSQIDNRPEIIKGKIITLKRLKPSYYNEYFKMLNDPKILKPLKMPSKITNFWVKTYLKKELKREMLGKTFLYIIFDNKDDRLVGSIEIREYDPNDNGQFGIWINPKYWGRGRFQEAFKLISNEYFKITKKNKFIAHVEMWNLRSYYALKKCGFKLIKTLHYKNQPSRYLLEYINPKTK